MNVIPKAITRRESKSWKTKHSRIIAAALEDFLQHGIAGANMDRIADEAEVSKVTIYNHFENKEQLFQVALQYYLESIHPGLPSLNQSVESDPRMVLTDYAARLISVMGSDQSIGVMRLLQEYRLSHPDQQGSFDEIRLWPRLDDMALYLIKESEIGRLKVQDPLLAARLFHGVLLGSYIYPRLLLPVTHPLSAMGVDGKDLPAESLVLFVLAALAV